MGGDTPTAKGSVLPITLVGNSLNIITIDNVISVNFYIKACSDVCIKQMQITQVNQGNYSYA